MPAIFPFTGARLSLQSVQTLSPLRLRIRYTTVPNQTSPYGATDALNPANYTLGGPGVSAVVTVIPVPGDDMAFDLTCSAAMLTGLWTITVANVLTPTAAALVSPTTLSFTSTYLRSTDTSSGLVQQGSYEILRKHLSSVFKGPKWRGLLQTIAASDDVNFANARAAFDQLFVNSASGRYLTERGADRGIERPEGVGLSDEDFRRLIIAVTAEKLTEEAFLEVLEVFYGKDLLHAWLETEVGGPFTLVDESELTLDVDGTHYTIIFHSAEFRQISAATATEIAITITRQLKLLGCNGWAEARLDPLSGEERLRIYSPRMGLSSRVVITGGTSQGVLLFPARRLTFGALPGVETGLNWAVSEPTLGRMQLVLSGATTTDLTTVVAGDYLLVQGANFATANRGCWQVISVDIRYVGATLVQTVIVGHPEAVFLQASVAIVATTDLLFFHSNVGASSGVIVSHARAGTVDVVLPATAQIVSRREGRAAYLQDPAVITDVIDLVRDPSGLVTVTTTSAHPLEVGDWITIDDFVSDGNAPTTAPGLPTLPASPVSILSTGTPTGTAHYGSASCLLADGVTVFSNGGLDTAGTALLLSRRWTTTSGPTVLTNGAIQYVESNPATASSASARQFALASLVPNGRVLRTGGRDAGDSTSSTELYDPVGNTWTTPPAMSTGRIWHFQLSLPDGRVLVGGGDGGTSPAIATKNTCELFTSDGAGSGAWAATGSMNFARAGATATLLDDGRVLVCGGHINQGTSYSATHYGRPTWTAEIYDPVTGVWTQTGNMGVGRTHHAAALLPDGRVLVSGGRCCTTGNPISNFYSTHSEIYDPTTGRWSVLSDPLGQAWCNLAMLNGVPHLLNGIGSGTLSKRIWYLDLAKMEWRLSVWQNIEVVWADVVARADGTLFQGGGTNGTALASHYLYIPNSNQFVSRGINGDHRITAKTGTTFSFQSEAVFTHGTSLTLTRQASPDRAWKGPYLAEPFGITIGAPASETTTDLVANASNQSVDLVDASGFPEDGGQVIFDFGYEARGPIPYLRRLGNTLVLDAGARLATPVDAGATATYVISREGFEPAQFDGAFYLTGASQGRIAAESFLERIRAAGLPMDKTILYPGDRGLGGEGFPAEATDKLSDKVAIWAGDDVDADLAAAREGV